MCQSRQISILKLRRAGPTWLVLLAVVILVDTGHDAAAEPRRSARRSTPAAPVRTAPDVTGTIPSPKPAVSRDDDEVLKPYHLPAAPRSHMKACGEKWQAIKMSGQAGDQTWRDFATDCLTKMAEPATPPR